LQDRRLADSCVSVTQWQYLCYTISERTLKRPFFAQAYVLLIGYEMDYRMLHCTMSRTRATAPECEIFAGRLASNVLCGCQKSPSGHRCMRGYPDRFGTSGRERGAEARKSHRPVANCGGGRACLVPSIERTRAAIAPARAFHATKISATRGRGRMGTQGNR
jgi:hypothetical protein